MMKEYKIYRILLGEETAHSPDGKISDFQTGMPDKYRPVHCCIFFFIFCK